jgi:multidrug resistance efflux pump
VPAASSAVIAEGNLVPRDNQPLLFSLAGRVAEILAAEGDDVTAGQVIARLGDREQFDAAIAAAELERLSAQIALDQLNEQADRLGARAELDLSAAQQNLLQAQQVLDDLDTDEYRDELDDLRKAVNDAEQELEDAQEEFDKVEALDEDDPDRQDAEDSLRDARRAFDQAVRDRDQKVFDLAAAQAGVFVAEADLADASRTQEDLQSGPDPDQLSLAEARLSTAAAQLAAAQSALDNLELLAPITGTLVELDLVEGQEVIPAQPVGLVADFSEWYVETNDLSENEVVRIEEDMDVSIVPDALPELELDGSVESISDTFIERAGDITYIARILLDEVDPRLRWGMTVEVRFED